MERIGEAILWERANYYRICSKDILCSELYDTGHMHDYCDVDDSLPDGRAERWSAAICLRLKTPHAPCCCRKAVSAHVALMWTRHIDIDRRHQGCARRGLNHMVVPRLYVVRP